jgi:UDP-N-acetyl-D-galactosamine dehydrogenase
VHDPVAAAKASHEYGVDLVRIVCEAAAIVAAVAHREFKARPLSDYLGP